MARHLRANYSRGPPRAAGDVSRPRENRDCLTRSGGGSRACPSTCATPSTSPQCPTSCRGDYKSGWSSRNLKRPSRRLIRRWRVPMWALPLPRVPRSAGLPPHSPLGSWRSANASRSAGCSRAAHEWRAGRAGGAASSLACEPQNVHLIYSRPTPLMPERRIASV